MESKLNSVSIGGSARATKKRISLNPSPVASRLAEFIAPTDHAGKGGWDDDSRIPPIAWFYAVIFIILFLIVLPALGELTGFR